MVFHVSFHNVLFLLMKSYLPTLLALAVAVFTGLGIWYFLENIIGLRNYGNGGEPTGKLEYIIDADTANEVDDLFAIVGAIARDDRGGTQPKLAGITAAQFHNSPLAGPRTADESQAINERLVRLMERPQLRTLVGSNQPLPDKNTPLKSPAAAFIAERASLASPQNKLQVFVLGSCTNVASALLLDPAIAPVIHVRYLGFWYDPATGDYDKEEFNTGNDPIALNLLLNTPGLEFTVMTATTSEALQMTRRDLDERLPQRTPLTGYLKDRWDGYERWWTEADPDKTRWTMWDVASLEAWFEPELAKLEQRPAPPDNARREIGVYVDIEEERMLDNYFRIVSDYAEGLSR